jgi:hypothetical protein
MSSTVLESEDDSGGLGGLLLVMSLYTKKAVFFIF